MIEGGMFIDWWEPDNGYVCDDCPFQIDDFWHEEDSTLFRAEEHVRSTGHHVFWVMDRNDPDSPREQVHT